MDDTPSYLGVVLDVLCRQMLQYCLKFSEDCLVLFQYVIYRAIFFPICDLPLATPHTASDVPPATR